MKKFMQERVQNVTQTVDNYEVKDLTWLPMDNLYRGLVKDPIRGRETLHNGFIVCTWRKNGVLTTKYGGDSRKDLYLKMT